MMAARLQSCPFIGILSLAMSAVEREKETKRKLQPNSKVGFTWYLCSSLFGCFSACGATLEISSMAAVGAASRWQRLSPHHSGFFAGKEAADCRSPGEMFIFSDVQLWPRRAARIEMECHDDDDTEGYVEDCTLYMEE